jgi:hypothetical protein
MPRVRRVNSAVPNSYSSCRICKLSGGCLMPSRPAARVKCRSSATATKYRRCLRSILANTFQISISHNAYIGQSRWQSQALAIGPLWRPRRKQAMSTDADQFAEPSVSPASSSGTNAVEDSYPMRIIRGVAFVLRCSGAAAMAYQRHACSDCMRRFGLRFRQWSSRRNTCMRHDHP